MATKRPRGRPVLAGPGKLGTMKAVKKSLEKNKANELVKLISSDGITTRFLDEPHEMVGYYEHWINGPRPCVEGGDCEGCNSDVEDERRRSYRYLANAYVVDDQAVRAVKLPKTVFELLVGYYESKGTLLDRDYELKKKGSGKEGTSYLASPDSPQRIKLSRFKKLDLDSILYAMLGYEDELEEDEDDDEEEEETPRRRKPKSTKKKRYIVEDDDEDDEDEDEEEDDDEDEEPPRRRVKSKTAVKKKKLSGLNEFAPKKKKKTTTVTRSIKRNR